MATITYTQKQLLQLLENQGEDAYVVDDVVTTHFDAGSAEHGPNPIFSHYQPNAAGLYDVEISEFLELIREPAELIRILAAAENQVLYVTMDDEVATKIRSVHLVEGSPRYAMAEVSVDAFLQAKGQLKYAGGIGLQDWWVL